MYYIDWGDSTTSGWIGPFSSGVIVSQEHAWVSSGSYEIQAKAKDWHGAESNWSDPYELSITAPELMVGMKGGFGVTITVTNIGDAPATNVSWSITSDRGVTAVLSFLQLILEFFLLFYQVQKYQEKCWYSGLGKRQCLPQQGVMRAPLRTPRFKQRFSCSSSLV